MCMDCLEEIASTKSSGAADINLSRVWLATKFRL